ncbi:hypothetical protein, conserved [Plasmodium gonderi]|uniref:HTH OST-type domain-containing protein n=1 Tax=Plasmodium gonderi TaxID=77519 RepID=A0A1Y1JFV0_PLAGO|nr:hypothetical protein, conserved [Plasmodium gonderi]GAW81401.1 hypothetical protein, conserved [Plasmodium gonderi]
MQENVKTKINDAKSCLMNFLTDAKKKALFLEKSDSNILDKSSEKSENRYVSSSSGEKTSGKCRDDLVAPDDDSEALKKRKTGTVLSKRSEKCVPSKSEKDTKDSISKSGEIHDDSCEVVCQNDTPENDEFEKNTSPWDKQIKRSNLSDAEYIESLKCEIDEKKGEESLQKYENTKKNLIMLVKSFGYKGIKIEKISGEYCKKYNALLNLSHAGFSNIYDLIKSLDHCLICEEIKEAEIKEEEIKEAEIKEEKIKEEEIKEEEIKEEEIKVEDKTDEVVEHVNNENDKNKGIIPMTYEQEKSQQADETNDTIENEEKQINDKEEKKTKVVVNEKHNQIVENNLIIKYKTPKMNEDKIFFLKIILGTVAECTNYNPELTDNETPINNSLSLTKLQQEVRKLFGSFFNLKILQTRCGIDKLQTFLEDIQEIQTISCPNDIKLRITPETFSYKIPELKSIKLIRSNEFKFKSPSKISSKKFPISTHLSDKDFRLNSLNAAESILGALNNKNRYSSIGTTHLENGTTTTTGTSDRNGFKKKKSHSNASLALLNSSKLHERICKSVSGGKTPLYTAGEKGRPHVGIDSFVFSNMASNVVSDCDNGIAFEINRSFSNDPYANLLNKLNGKDSSINSGVHVGMSSNEWIGRQHTNELDNHKENLIQMQNPIQNTRHSQNSYIKILTKTQLHILLYQLIVLLTERQKVEWDEISRIKDSLLNQSRSKAYQNKNLESNQQQMNSSIQVNISKIECTSDSAIVGGTDACTIQEEQLEKKIEVKEIHSTEVHGHSTEGQKNSATNVSSDFMNENFSTQETSNLYKSENMGDEKYTKNDHLSNNFEKENNTASEKFIGVFVSSIKSEWNKAYMEQYPLSFYLNYYKEKKLRRLIEEIPNLVIVGYSRNMQIFTLDTAQDYFDNFFSEKSTNLKTFARSRFTTLSTSNYFKDTTYKELAQEFINGIYENMMKILGFYYLKPPQLSVSKSYEKIMNKSRKNRNSNNLSTCINYSNQNFTSLNVGSPNLSSPPSESKPFFHSNSKPLFHSNSKPLFHSNSKPLFHSNSKPLFHSNSNPFFENESIRVLENDNLEVLRYHLHKLLYNLVIHVCKNQNLLYLAYKKNGIILSEYEMNKQMCGPIYYSSDLTYEDFITTKQTFFEKEQVMKSVFLLSQHGIYGIKFIHLTNEWYKLYKCELRPLMRVCKYEQIGKMISSLPNVLVVGEGFDTKYIPNMQLHAESNRLDIFSNPLIPKMASDNPLQHIPTFQKRSLGEPNIKTHKKSGPYESIMGLLFPDIISQRSSGHIQKYHRGSTSFFKDNNQYKKNKSAFPGMCNGYTFKNDININHLFKNL